MKYAIVSDIHANESALRHVLADAASVGVRDVVCLGDVVGYGPLPRETLALVREVAAAVLAGNHDDAVSGRQGAGDFIDLAGDAVARHREALDADALSWLRTLPYECRIGEALAAHGDFTDPKVFNYVDSESAAGENFEATDAQLMFVGHTHVPCLYLTGQSGKVYRLEAQDFVLEDGKRYLVNPGSVGYPREENGTCRSSYVIYDTVERSVTFRFLPFSVSSVMQRGKNPRRRIGLAVAAALLAVAGGFAALFFAQREPVEKTRIVEVKAEDDPSLALDRRSLTLAPGHQYVQANLKIDRQAAPVTLQITFRSPAGETVGELTETVKGSSAKRFKIPSAPARAVSAHFTVRKQQPEDRPKVLSFAPTAR